MIDMRKLEQGKHYVFPCKTYEDYLEAIESVKLYDSTARGNRSAVSIAKDWWANGRDRGAIRVLRRFDGTAAFSYASLEFYKEGGYVHPVTIVEIEDYRDISDLDDWECEADISLLISCMEGEFS